MASRPRVISGETGGSAASYLHSLLLGSGGLGAGWDLVQEAFKVCPRWRLDVAFPGGPFEWEGVAGIEAFCIVWNLSGVFGAITISMGYGCRCVSRIAASDGERMSFGPRLPMGCQI
jgi:hypothetical protein